MERAVQAPEHGRDRWVVMLGILVVGAGVAGLLAIPYYPVGAFNDDAGFALGARTLISTGALPPPTNLLPGQSLLLAPVMWLFAGSLLALHLEMLAVTLTAGTLLACWSRPVLGARGSILLAAVFLLNPVMVPLGTTFMSDVTLASLVIAGLTWDRLVPASRRTDLGLGLLAGFAILVRLPAVALGAALVGRRVLCRDWKGLGRLVAAQAIVVLPFLPRIISYVHIMRYHRSLVDKAPLALTGEWIVRFPNDLINSFVGWHLHLPIAVLFYPLMAWGGLRLWRSSRYAVTPILFLGCILLIHLQWPADSPRYYLAVWPLCALLWAYCLPPRWRPYLLLAVLLLQGPAVAKVLTASQQRAPMHQPRFLCYDWLKAHRRAGDRVIAIYNRRVQLLTGVPSVSYRGGITPTMGDALAQACQVHANYLLYDRYPDVGRSFSGQPLLGLPARLDIWLEHSSLVRLRCSTPWDALFSLKVPPALYLRAYKEYRSAVWPWPRKPAAALAPLRRALRLVPDFPLAERTLGYDLFAAGHVDAARSVLEKLVRAYPIDFNAAHNLAVIDFKSGHPKRAEELLRKEKRYVEKNSLQNIARGLLTFPPATTRETSEKKRRR